MQAETETFNQNFIKPFDHKTESTIKHVSAGVSRCNLKQNEAYHASIGSQRQITGGQNAAVGFWL